MWACTCWCRFKIKEARDGHRNVRIGDKVHCTVHMYSGTDMYLVCIFRRIDCLIHLLTAWNLIIRFFTFWFALEWNRTVTTVLLWPKTSNMRAIIHLFQLSVFHRPRFGNLARANVTIRHTTKSKDPVDSFSLRSLFTGFMAIRLPPAPLVAKLCAIDYIAKLNCFLWSCIFSIFTIFWCGYGS